MSHSSTGRPVVPRKIRKQCDRADPHEGHEDIGFDFDYVCVGIPVAKEDTDERFCGDDQFHLGHKYVHSNNDYWCVGLRPGMELVPRHETTRDACEDFIRECGLEPTPDAVGQLAEVFLPCLRIMCERGYSPDGSTWRAEGWRGMLWKAYDKMERLWYHSWTHGRFHDDSVFDGINYLGFYWRSRKEGGDGWGKRGVPGDE